MTYHFDVKEDHEGYQKSCYTQNGDDNLIFQEPRLLIITVRSLQNILESLNAAIGIQSLRTDGLSHFRIRAESKCIKHCRT